MWQGSCKVGVIEYLTEQEVLNMDSNYIIETKNLTKQYGSQKSVVNKASPQDAFASK